MEKAASWGFSYSMRETSVSFIPTSGMLRVLSSSASLKQYIFDWWDFFKFILLLLFFKLEREKLFVSVYQTSWRTRRLHRCWRMTQPQSAGSLNSSKTCRRDRSQTRVASRYPPNNARTSFRNKVSRGQEIFMMTRTHFYTQSGLFSCARSLA